MRMRRPSSESYQSMPASEWGLAMRATTVVLELGVGLFSSCALLCAELMQCTVGTPLVCS